MATQIVPAPVRADHQGPTVLLSFPSASGVTVEVQAVGGDYLPYRWVCPAGHGGHGYASLPFCRDDAKAHAAECRGAVVDPAVRLGEVAAECRRRSAVAVSAADFDALLCVQDELAMCRCQLADVERAVVRYEIAKATFDRLSAMDARDMSGHQFTLMGESQDEMAERRAFLESVGQLHRIEMA